MLSYIRILWFLYRKMDDGRTRVDTGRLCGSCNNPGETTMVAEGGQSGSIYLPVACACVCTSAIRMQTPDGRCADCGSFGPPISR